MKRPYIICHMLESDNGKVTGSFLLDEKCAKAAEEYYFIHSTFNASAFACGRVTMEESFTHGWQPDLSPYTGIKMDRTDYISRKAPFYAAAFDRKGRLGWKDHMLHDADPGYDQAEIIEVLCSDLVSDEYLAYLRDKGISYLFGGETELNLKLVCEKLGSLLGMELLLLEGGPVLNGAFEKAGLIDEMSVVQAPLAAKDGAPVCGNVEIRDYKLKDRVDLGNGIYWISLQKKR